MQALIASAQDGYLGCMRALLDSKSSIDVNHEATEGASALYMAAQEGHTAAVKALLAVDGVWVNRAFEHGSVALHIASKHGHTDVVAALLFGGGCRFRLSTHPYYSAALPGTLRTGKTPVDVAAAGAVRLVFAAGSDYWHRRRHLKYAHTLQRVVHTLVLVARRLSMPANTHALPHLPEEIWLLVCESLRSADFVA